MAEEIKQGFIRQRRNLILISLILLFVEVAEVSFNKINLLGNELTISNPDVVTYSLWVAFIYWLIRYYQYFNDMPEKGIHSAVISRMNKLVPLVAVEKYKKDADLSAIFPDIDGAPEITLREAVVRTRTNKYWELGVSIDAAIGDGDNKHGHTNIGIGVQLVNEQELRVPRIKAWLSVIFTTRLFSEYFLPFLIAVITIVSKLWVSYAGNILA